MKNRAGESMVIRAGSKCALLLVLLVCAGLPATIAGELYLSWSPTPGAAGYRVHVGPSSGNYPQITDTGAATAVDLTWLSDCAPSYFAVTAYNAGGESGYSPELSSWPRPTVSSVVSDPLEQGTQRTLVISGNNFRVGDAVVFTHQGIQVNSVQVTSCGEMIVTVTMAPSATLGLSALSIVHPSGVTGGYGSTLSVVAPILPAVLAAVPVDGSMDVPVEVQPTVEFSETVFGITSSNLQLVDQQGAPVAQAAGSPVLSQDGTLATIVPGDPLAGGITYRVQILGAAGIVDQDGHPLESGYMQGEGFTTIGDDSPPSASDPTATGIGGTTAVIEWTTDEPASGRVFYRKQGGTLYQAAEGADDVLDHAVTLTGLAPETVYEFHVGSTDGSGNTATSSPDTSFTTGFSPYSYIRFESEAGMLASPIDSTPDASGFGGHWIGAAPGSGQGTSTTPLGHADYSVLLPHDGEWQLWIRVYAPDGASDSWFESIDGAAFEPVATSEHGEWVWVAGRAYTLAAGLHEVQLGGHESGAQADRILLTDDPEFLPTEAPDVDVTPPAPVSGLEAAFGGNQIQLQWTNPADGDLSRVVLRYRADGQYPMSPVDGLPLVDGPAAPGADGAYSHTGVNVGLTYNYAIFAVDAFDNVSIVTQGSALALAPPPPPAGVSVE